MAIYLEAIKQAIRILNNPRMPAQLLEEWKYFVSEAIEGYSWTVFEYIDEIGVREDIYALETNDELYTFDEFRSFLTDVHSIDAKLKSILLHLNLIDAPIERWWLHGIPHYGRECFASSVLDRDGIKILRLDDE